MYAKANIERWQDFKFGMFIHYGLYSLLGEGEWVMFNKPMDKDEYALLTQRFTAEHFDAPSLAKLAKAAGMRYMVLTTRHHDGFCLFDSKFSIDDYTVMRTPAKRDLVREYADACRGEGVGVGFYYSPMDWRCEGFFFPQMYHRSALRMRAQCHGQVRELMENYGKVDVLWYDGGEDYWLAHGKHLNNGSEENFRQNPLIPGFWGEEELNSMARTLQPGIVINNRLGARKCGDYDTPERVIGAFNTHRPWETCDALAESWGWQPNTQVRSLQNVVHLLTDVITGDGNLLLNVSPMPDGSIEPAHTQRLREVGAWLQKYGESVYGTRGGPVKNDWTVGGAVWKDNAVYFHIKTPECAAVRLPLPDMESFDGDVICLTGEEAPAWRFDGGMLEITLPQNRNEIETIVKITLPERVDRIFESFDPEGFNAYCK